MIKGIMFDMGGTLMNDDNLSFERAFNNVYDHFKYKKFLKSEYDSLIKDLLKDTLFNRTTFDIKFKDFINYLLFYFDDELDCSMEELEEYFSYGFSNDTLVDSIIDYLDYLKSKKLKLIVLSNTFLSSKEIKRRLDNLGISKYFDEIIASSDYLVRKPSKLFFEVGLKKIGLKNNEVLYVGNSYTFDVEGCNNSLINIIFYNVNHYKEYDFSKLNIKVKEIKDYKEIIGEDLCQIF